MRDVQYASTTNLNARVALHEKYSTAQQGWFEWLAEQIDWDTPSEVLEAGCGSGLLWTQVPKHAGENLRVTLTDISQGMVQTALNVARTTVRHVEGMTSDVHDLPFEDDSFDLVIANHMLYHTPNPAVAIEELARVLRPGGVLVASTNGPRHLQELYEIETKLFDSSVARSNVETFGSVTGLPLLTQRFGEVEWRHHSDGLRCTEAADVIAYITSTPPGSNASPEKLTELNAEVLRRMDESGGVLAVSKESGAFFAFEQRA